VRFDGTGKFDALRQIIGRIHVELQQGLVADRPAHWADPLCLRSDSAPSGLELDGAVAEFEKPRQYGAVIVIGCRWPIIAAGSVGEERPIFPAEQAVDRHIGGLPLMSQSAMSIPAIAAMT